MLQQLADVAVGIADRIFIRRWPGGEDGGGGMGGDGGDGGGSAVVKVVMVIVGRGDSS